MAAVSRKDAFLEGNAGKNGMVNLSLRLPSHPSYTIRSHDVVVDGMYIDQSCVRRWNSLTTDDCFCRIEMWSISRVLSRGSVLSCAFPSSATTDRDSELVGSTYVQWIYVSEGFLVFTIRDRDHTRDTLPGTLFVESISVACRAWVILVGQGARRLFKAFTQATPICSGFAVVEGHARIATFESLRYINLFRASLLLRSQIDESPAP